MLTCPVTADCQAVLLHEFYLGLLEKLTTSLGHVMIVVTSHMIRRKWPEWIRLHYFVRNYSRYSDCYCYFISGQTLADKSKTWHLYRYI